MGVLDLHVNVHVNVHVDIDCVFVGCIGKSCMCTLIRFFVHTVLSVSCNFVPRTVYAPFAPMLTSRLHLPHPCRRH